MHPAAVADVVTSAPVPPNFVQNLENPDYIGQKIVVCNAACLTLAGVLVMLRLYTRGWIARNIRLDDVAMFLALVFSICLTVSTVMLTYFGLGVHMWDLPLSKFTPHFMRWNLIAAMLYCVVIMFTKLSILFLYLRLSPSSNFRIVVYSLMAVAVGYNIASVFANLFSCSPIAGSWDLAIKSVCINRPVLYYINSALNITTDFAILVLPVKLVWKLHMPRRQKYSVLAIFMAGGFVCIASIIRLYTLHDLQKSADLTWASVNVLVWCVIEVNIGIICGSLSTIKPFLRQHFPSLLGSTTGGDAYRSSDNSAVPTPLGHQSRSRKKSHSIPLSSIDVSGSRLDLGEGSVHEVVCKSHSSRHNQINQTSKLGFRREDEDGISEEHIMAAQPVGIVRATEVAIQFSHRDGRRGSSSAGSEDDQGSIVNVFSSESHGQ